MEARSTKLTIAWSLTCHLGGKWRGWGGTGDGGNSTRGNQRKWEIRDEKCMGELLVVRTPKYKMNKVLSTHGVCETINIIEIDLRWAILWVTRGTTLELLLENTQMSMSSIITDSLYEYANRNKSLDIMLRAWKKKEGMRKKRKTNR